MAEGGNKLSEEEICEILRDLTIPVRINDLKNPSREFIVRVFECFVKGLQISIDELRTWEANKHIEDPNIYEEAQFLISLIVIVNCLTSSSGLNITIKDVVEPKPKRTKKILNYILIFWNYYITKYARYRAVEMTFDEEKKKAEDLILENKSLDEKYDDMLNVLQSMEPKKDVLITIVAEKKKKVDELNTEQQNLMADYQVLKTKEANIRNEIGVMNVNIVSAKENLEELNQLILSSPDRMTKEIQKLKEKIKAKDLKIKDKENETKDSEKRLQTQENSLKDHEKALTLIKNLSEDIQNVRNQVESLLINVQKLDEEEEKVKKIQSDLKRKEEWKSLHDQKSAKIVLNAKKQRETLMEFLNIQKNEEVREKEEIELIEASINDMDIKIENVSDYILEMNNSYRTAEALTNERIFQYKTMMRDISNCFRVDCEELEQRIKNIQQ